jgi:hypothetical protein
MKLQKDEIIFKLGLLLVLIGCLNGVISIVDWITIGGVKYIVMMIVSIITLIVGNPMLIIGLVMPPQKNK